MRIPLTLNCLLLRHRTRAELRLKDDREKVRIARRLRAERAVNLKWIAACLLMGTWTYLANRAAVPLQAGASAEFSTNQCKY